MKRTTPFVILKNHRRKGRRGRQGQQKEKAQPPTPVTSYLSQDREIDELDCPIPLLEQECPDGFDVECFFS